MATKILEELKTNLALLEMEPAGGGCFEVSVDGEEIYSKLATGEFPAEESILNSLRSRAP